MISTFQEILQCDLCNKCFSSANGLKFHYSMAHKNFNVLTNEQEFGFVIGTTDNPIESNEPHF